MTRIFKHLIRIIKHKYWVGLEESYEILKYVVDEIKLNQQGNQ